MTPEEKAREKIDGLLQQCGWEVHDRSTSNLTASEGEATCEGAIRTGEIHYLLISDGKGIETVDAKPEANTRTRGERQNAKCGKGQFDKHPCRGNSPAVQRM